jgi:hypothetical protein
LQAATRPATRTEGVKDHMCSWVTAVGQLTSRSPSGPRGLQGQQMEQHREQQSQRGDRAPYQPLAAGHRQCKAAQSQLHSRATRRQGTGNWRARRPHGPSTDSSIVRGEASRPTSPIAAGHRQCKAAQSQLHSRATRRQGTGNWRARRQHSCQDVELRHSVGHQCHLGNSQGKS